MIWFFEERGLIEAGKRSEYGYRLYSAAKLHPSELLETARHTGL
tara:strand:+ start:6340 stop:6471 length:132 start_codon:yes stop_codon:yes gene_type:complete